MTRGAADDGTTTWTRTGRLPALTGLRFIAAISVVIHHFGTGRVPEWTRPYFEGGGYLVDVFFVLSGFLLGYAYARRSTGLTTSRTRFMVSRIARLYPAYLLALVLAVEHFMDLLPGGSPVVAAAKIAVIVVLTLLFLQAWIPGAQSFNDPAWSLSNEVFFYGVMAVLAGPALRHWGLKQLAIGATTLCLASGVLLSVLDPGSQLQRLPLLRVAPFLLAVVAGVAFQRWRLGLARWLINTWQVGGFVLLLALVTVLPSETGYGHMLVSLVALALLPALAVGQGTLSAALDWRVSRLLGDASYGIYIYQVGIFYLMAAAFGDFVRDVPGFLVYLLILVGFSIVSALYFEPPARRWIERAAGWRGRRPRSESLPPSGATAHRSDSPASNSRT